MPISTDTVYSSNFNGESTFSKNDFVRRIFTKYTYKNSVQMLYPSIYGIYLQLKIDLNCNNIGPYSKGAS